MRGQHIAVLYGGVSAEREISLLSGQAVIEALRARGHQVVPVDLGANMVDQITALKADIAFIALHGGAGEDGRIQALLDLRGMPYTGSGVLASALALDKVRCKQLWLGIGLPTAEFSLLEPATDWAANLQQLGGRAMVKPVREGSSIGMAQARTAEELEAAYLNAAQYDSRVMAERWLSGREFSIGVLGELSLPIIQLQVQDEFYTYDAKYLSDATRYLCPAPLPTEFTLRLQRLALDAFRAVGCRGWGRVDLLLDEHDEPYLLEVNTVPGMTSHSLVPMAAREAGYEFGNLLEQILLEVSNGRD